ncbi:MAG: hypothetical protein J7484_15505 [Microbacterium sp.]|nr:hypothetical protein [Microbacterium sp.]
MDDDVGVMSRDELAAEVLRLRAAIREHRDSTSHDLCWYHPRLWSMLPEASTTEVAVPPWPQFMRGCVAYRESLDRELPDAPVADEEYRP